MLNVLIFTAGMACGFSFIACVYCRATFLPWLKTQFGHSDEKILLFLRTFQNRRIQPFQSVGWNGGMKAFLEKIKIEPYWAETDFSWKK